MAQFTDLATMEANAKRDTRNGSVWSDLTKPGFDDQYLHEEILTLLPRLERFARALTHDVVSTDDLVQDCLTRALEKIHMWQQESIFGRGYSQFYIANT